MTRREEGLGKPGGADEGGGYSQRPVAVLQLSSAAQAALEVQPQKGAMVPERGKQRRLGPHAVDTPHSHRIVEELQVLPVEQLVDVQTPGPHRPSDWHR
jgi:hypothetical protein